MACYEDFRWGRPAVSSDYFMYLGPCHRQEALSLLTKRENKVNQGSESLIA